MNHLSPQEFEQKERNPYFQASPPDHLGKGVKIFLIISVSIFLIGVVCCFIWFNISVSEGKLKGNSTINNQVQTPDIPIEVNVDERDTNEYEHTINNNIKIDEETKDEMVDEIVAKILEELKDE